MATGLFAVSTFFFLRNERKKRTEKSTTVSSTVPSDAMVSSRGVASLTPPIPYLGFFIDSLKVSLDLALRFDVALRSDVRVWSQEQI